MADKRQWDVIVALYGRVEQELTDSLRRQHGLGLSEYRALAQLATARDGELRIQELAAAIGLNQSSVSRLVVRLENGGLTRRALCPNDRRGVYSVITDLGRAQVDAAEPTYRETLTAALDKAAAEPDLAGVVYAVRDIAKAAP
ncbi:MAG: MarR family transcriptional regulator [Kutzneria sp.]|nr:MarR family transcriptional regulator [Kutzneria sp.]